MNNYAQTIHLLSRENELFETTNVRPKSRDRASPWAACVPPQINDRNGNENVERINRIGNGKLTNFHTNTAKILANALGVKIDDVVE